MAAYHPVSDGIVDEDHPQEPDGSGTTYHDTKLESELLALEYGRERELSVAVLQPAAVYGPGSHPWSVRVLEQLRDHTMLFVGETSHNVVYVDDVARAMVLAAEQDGIDGECFVVSGGEDILSADFYRAHERMLGIACVAVATAQELDSVDGDLEVLARLKGMPEDRPVLTGGFGSKVSLFLQESLPASGFRAGGRLCHRDETHRSLGAAVGPLALRTGCGCSCQ